MNICPAQDVVIFGQVVYHEQTFLLESSFVIKSIVDKEHLPVKFGHILKERRCLDVLTMSILCVWLAHS